MTTIGPLLTKAVTAGPSGDDLGCDPLFFDLLFEGRGNLPLPVA